MAEKGGEGADPVAQLKAIGDYASRCSAGYSELENYLGSLYNDLDGLVNKPLDAKLGQINPEIKKAHEAYEKNLKAARREVAKSSKLEALVKKALSGSFSSEEEQKQVYEAIGNDYKAVLGASSALYQLLNPEIDASGLMPIYGDIAKIRKKEIIPKFKAGVEILEKYYISSDMAKQIKAEAEKAKAQAGKAHPTPEAEEMPQAA